MYSDAKKFPNSGGYVWLSEAAQNKYISVFKSSIFETIIQPPSVVLKLIYHYVCQTSLNNVLTWVKVDNGTVDTFFRHIRCLCIASVQEEIVNLGGDNKAIELGVISLGTTTTDGNRREVKVEVLGVLERGTGRMRLRATEPIAGTNQAERFARIFKVNIRGLKKLIETHHLCHSFWVFFSLYQLGFVVTLRSLLIFLWIGKDYSTWGTPMFSNVVLVPRPSGVIIQIHTSWSISNVSYQECFR